MKGMKEITSEAELQRCFREIDRDEVEQPDKVRFPLVVNDSYAWSSGNRVFLLFRDRAAALPKGLVFHRNTGAVPDVPAMCEWCHVVRGHGEVKLLSVAMDDRRRLGMYLCHDLRCIEKARELPGTNDFHEGLDVDARVKKIVERIALFASRRLF